MAKKREGPVQALTISLIIFVMCTFVLAVTTYVFYAQNEDDKEAKKAADDADNQARQSLALVEQTQKDLLESRIGVNEGDSIEAVDKELAALQEKAKKYGGEENATPTYRELIKTLDKALVNKDSANKTLEANVRDLEVELAASRASLDEKTESHSAAIDEKQKELAKVSQDAQKWQDDFTERYQASVQEIEKERVEKERLIALEDQIKKFVLPSMRSESQEKYKAAKNEFEEAIRINKKIKKEDSSVYINLGNVYGKLNGIDLAIENFKKAVKANPQFADAHQNLIRAELNKKGVGLSWWDWWQTSRFKKWIGEILEIILGGAILYLICLVYKGGPTPFSLLILIAIAVFLLLFSEIQYFKAGPFEFSKEPEYFSSQKAFMSNRNNIGNS